MEKIDATLIISGGSRGLGAVLAAHYLDRGCRVATFARQESPETKACGEKHGDRFYFEALDAASARRIDQFVEQVTRRFGGIHGLINNAAVGQDHLLVHISPEMIDQIIAVNLRGPILLTRAVLRRMLLNPGGGRVVNVTSICGSRGYAGLTVYSATKGGLDAFTRALAREVGSRNILVNSIAPGFFESQMSSVLASEQLATIKRRTPTECLCTPEHLLPVLDMLLFAAINLTGQTISVDGGSSI